MNRSGFALWQVKLHVIHEAHQLAGELSVEIGIRLFDNFAAFLRFDDLAQGGHRASRVAGEGEGRDRVLGIFIPLANYAVGAFGAGSQTTVFDANIRRARTAKERFESRKCSNHG